MCYILGEILWSEGTSKLHKQEAQNVLALPQNVLSVITSSPNSYTLMAISNHQATGEKTIQA